MLRSGGQQAGASPPIGRTGTFQSPYLARRPCSHLGGALLSGLAGSGVLLPGVSILSDNEGTAPFSSRGRISSISTGAAAVVQGLTGLGFASVESLWSLNCLTATGVITRGKPRGPEGWGELQCPRPLQQQQWRSG